MSGDSGDFGQMNLAAVKRCDPSATAIVDSATQVALYKYSLQLSEWEKTEIQGAFFIYKRSQHPHHCCLILNRLSMDNLIQPLTGDLQFRLQTPFLLYRNGDGDIFGLWFFYDKECALLASRMETLCDQANSGQTAAAAAVADSAAADGHTQTQAFNLLSLLNSAANHKKAPSDKDPSLSASENKAVSGGASSGATTTGSLSADATSSITVHDLFAKASKMGQQVLAVKQQTDRTMSVSEVEGSMSHSPHQLHSLLSHPPPLACHRPPPPAPLSTDSGENSDVTRIQQLFSCGRLQQRQQQQQPLLPLQQPPPLSQQQQPPPLSQQQQPPLSQQQQQPPQAAVATVSKPPALAVVSSDSAANTTRLPSVAPKPAASCEAGCTTLMSPMMFTPAVSASAPAASAAASASAVLVGSCGEPSTSAPCSPSEPATATASSRHPLAAATGSGSDAPEPLTARQLSQALSYLLNNDEAFVEQLHAAYINSLSSHYRRC